MSDGRIVSLHVCTGHFEPMDDVGSVNMLAGFGIEGDRHATDSPSRKHRQVLLMDEETLDVFGLRQGEVRENVTTSGIDITHVVEGGVVNAGDSVKPL